MKKLLIFLLLFLFWPFILIADPTELRSWKSTSGHSIKAKALKVENGKVHLKREDGRVVKVPLSKFVEADEIFLTKHFKLSKNTAGGSSVSKPDEGESADDLPYPLGKVTSEVECGDGAHCYLYFPKSLRKGAKHPILFIMSPGGGNPGIARRYMDGAERNRWILAVSKQSKNGYKGSGDAVMAMIKYATSTLPIDERRMYTSGMSGGSFMAYWTSQQEKKIAGIIACGAGASTGSKKQVVYGLCGTNCFNRTGMAASFKKVSHKGAILRYFEGQHVWADKQLCDDAITHLNGVFLAENQPDYQDEYKHYIYQLGELIKSAQANDAKRAYMWADFMQRYDMKHPDASKALSQLGGDEANRAFVKGLYDIRKFAEKQFGDNPASQWKIAPKVSSACVREAKKYAGSYWENILMKMSENAKKF